MFCKPKGSIQLNEQLLPFSEVNHNVQKRTSCSEVTCTILAIHGEAFCGPCFDNAIAKRQLEAHRDECYIIDAVGDVSVVPCDGDELEEHDWKIAGHSTSTPMAMST